MREMLFENWKVLFKNTNQTPPKAFVYINVNKKNVIVLDY